MSQQHLYAVESKPEGVGLARYEEPVTTLWWADDEDHAVEQWKDDEGLSADAPVFYDVYRVSQRYEDQRREEDGVE